MSQIQVNPEVLRNIADELDVRAQRVRAAVDAVNAEVRRMISGEVLRGTRADALIARYQQIRADLEGWEVQIRQISAMLRKIADAFEEADRPDGGGLASAGGRGGKPPSTPPPLAPDGMYGGLPLYTMDLTELSHEQLEAKIRQMQLDGREVFFVLHGFRARDDSDDGFKDMMAIYQERYGQLPPDKRPAIVGLSWDSKVLDYNAANQNAIAAGAKFNTVLTAMNRFHRESNINVVAHSLGNLVVAEAVAQDGLANINHYLAIQPAVSSGDYLEKYQAVFNSQEIASMDVTYNENDKALWLHQANSAVNDSFEPAKGHFDNAVSELGSSLDNAGQGVGNVVSSVGKVGGGVDFGKGVVALGSSAIDFSQAVSESGQGLFHSWLGGEKLKTYAINDMVSDALPFETQDALGNNAHLFKAGPHVRFHDVSSEYNEAFGLNHSDYSDNNLLKKYLPDIR